MASGASIFSGFIDLSGVVGNYFFNEENTKLQKQQLALQRKQYELNQGMSFVSAKETLANIKEDYETALLQIAQQQELYSAYDIAIDRFGNYFANQIGQIQAQGVEQYQAGMTNWQNQLTFAAERGQSGRSADILAAIQRQSLVNFVGEDLTIDAEGGTFGSSLREAIADLNAERQEAISNRNILGQAIELNKMTAGDYRDSIKDILGSTLAIGYDAKKSYSELEELVNSYKDYLGNSDSEFEAIKKDLLKQYTPLEYRVTSYTYETETGGESEHGANIHEHTGYITWVKDQNGIWKQATSTQLKDLKKTYGKNYVNDYIKANEVLDVGDMRSKYTTKNGRYELTYNQAILQDSFQKLLENAGSRPK